MRYFFEIIATSWSSSDHFRAWNAASVIFGALVGAIIILVSS